MIQVSVTWDNGKTTKTTVGYNEEVPSYLANLPMERVESYTVARVKTGPSALAVMAEKLDNKRPDTTGYITHMPEIRAIMSEMSDLVSANVMVNGTAEGLVCAKIVFGFAVERELL